jgi:DNA-binding GntR family transcriptional regulator
MKAEPSGLAGRLSVQIVDYARRQQLEPGSHLTEQSLAAALQVSRSPVRRALAYLNEIGVVRRETNRGYYVEKLPPAHRTPLVHTTHDAEECYLRIADDRLTGRLEDQITEAALMRRYRLPRRELQRVLHRMEKEGWLERKPGHGWRFIALADTVEAHAESYRFRMLLEPAALLEPGFRIDAAEIARCRRDQEMLLAGGFMKVSSARLFELGSDFHETIVGFSGNRFMLDSLKRLNSMRRLLEYRAHVDRSRLIGQCREHLQLLDLLEHGHREKAARFLRQHLDIVRAIKTERGGKSTSRVSVPAQL